MNCPTSHHPHVEALARLRTALANLRRLCGARLEVTPQTAYGLVEGEAGGR